MRPPSEEEDFPLCKPFILFQGCLSPTVHHSLCSFYCFYQRRVCCRRTMWRHVCYKEPPWAVKLAHTHAILHIFRNVSPCLFASQVLTCGVALHLDDTFRFLAGFPGIEGPNPNSDFNRRSRHVCGVELSPLLKFLVYPSWNKKKQQFRFLCLSTLKGKQLMNYATQRSLRLIQHNGLAASFPPTILKSLQPTTNMADRHHWSTWLFCQQQPLVHF